MKQNKKSKFRSSAIWKKWRKVIYDKDEGKDYITGKKLLAGYNCHHLDMRDENYKDLTDKDKYLSLNKKTHQFLHWCFEYYKKDESILDRLKEILDLMLQYN